MSDNADHQGITPVAQHGTEGPLVVLEALVGGQVKVEIKPHYELIKSSHDEKYLVG